MGKHYRTTLEERISVDLHTGCWNWTGRRGADGYGVLRQQCKYRMAHRVVFEIVCGPIPDGLVLDHLCRNPSCVNPAHLEPVTQRENSCRGQSPTILLMKSGRCKHGHELTPENTYWTHDHKHRHCRICSAKWHREYRLRKRTEVA